MKLNEKDKNAEMVKSLVGTKITLMDGKQRILKSDNKGLYVLKDGVRSYVEYHKHSGRFSNTGEWSHNE